MEYDQTYSLLQICCSHSSLVLDHDVVAWLGSTLQSFVRLKIKIESVLAIAGDVTIDDKTGSRIV